MIKGKLIELDKWNKPHFDGGRYGTLKELEERILYKRVVEWAEDYLKLEDGTVITIEMSENDCCAYAGGTFDNVKLDAMITNVHISKIENGTRYGEIENKVTVNLFHNRNPIAQANITADAGNGDYYYSIGSLVIDKIHFPVVEA